MEDSEYIALEVAERDHPWFTLLHQMIIEEIRNFSYEAGRQVSVLDIGCGTGGLLEKISKDCRVSNWTGIEPSRLGQEACERKNLKIASTNLAEFKSDGKTWDIVLLIDVLFHKDVEPTEAVAKAVRLTSPDGVIIINTAALKNLKRRHDIRVMGARRFDIKEIRSLLKANNLQIEKAYYWNMVGAIHLLGRSLFQKLTQHTPLSEAAKERSELNANRASRIAAMVALWIDSRMRNRINLPFGSSIYAVARKQRS